MVSDVMMSVLFIDYTEHRHDKYHYTSFIVVDTMADGLPSVTAL